MRLYNAASCTPLGGGSANTNKITKVPSFSDPYGKSYLPTHGVPKSNYTFAEKDPQQSPLPKPSRLQCQSPVPRKPSHETLSWGGIKNNETLSTTDQTESESEENKTLSSTQSSFHFDIPLNKPSGKEEKQWDEDEDESCDQLSRMSSSTLTTMWTDRGDTALFTVDPQEANHHHLTKHPNKQVRGIHGQEEAHYYCYRPDEDYIRQPPVMTTSPKTAAVDPREASYRQLVKLRNEQAGVSRGQEEAHNKYEPTHDYIHQPTVMKTPPKTAAVDPREASYRQRVSGRNEQAGVSRDQEEAHYKYEPTNDYMHQPPVMTTPPKTATVDPREASYRQRVKVRNEQVGCTRGMEEAYQNYEPTEDYIHQPLVMKTPPKAEKSAPFILPRRHNKEDKVIYQTLKEEVEEEWEEADHYVPPPCQVMYSPVSSTSYWQPPCTKSEASRPSISNKTKPRDSNAKRSNHNIILFPTLAAPKQQRQQPLSPVIHVHKQEGATRSTRQHHSKESGPPKESWLDDDLEWEDFSGRFHHHATFLDSRMHVPPPQANKQNMFRSDPSTASSRGLHTSKSTDFEITQRRQAPVGGRRAGEDGFFYRDDRRILSRTGTWIGGLSSSQPAVTTKTHPSATARPPATTNSNAQGRLLPSEVSHFLEDRYQHSSTESPLCDNSTSVIFLLVVKQANNGSTASTSQSMTAFVRTRGGHWVEKCDNK
jgi:hypothetical protein